MIRFNRNDSLINNDLLPPTGGFNFTFKVSFIIQIISNISIQRFMFNISKHLCICNRRLNAFMSCNKQCVNTSKWHFTCSFCVDLICLVTAQMSYYSNSLIKCKNVTQKIMDTFRKNDFIKVKMTIKCKNQFKLIRKDYFLSVWTDHHTEYEKYQKL